jgi:hypothetical protein
MAVEAGDFLGITYTYDPFHAVNGKGCVPYQRVTDPPMSCCIFDWSQQALILKLDINLAAAHVVGGEYTLTTGVQQTKKVLAVSAIVRT